MQALLKPALRGGPRGYANTGSQAVFDSNCPSAIWKCIERRKERCRIWIIQQAWNPISYLPGTSSAPIGYSKAIVSYSLCRCFSQIPIYRSRERRKSRSSSQHRRRSGIPS